MRYFLLIGLICFLIDSAYAEQPFRNLDFDAALAAASKENKPIIIDFYATWCGPCKQLDKTTWKDAKVRAWLNENMIALKIDAEKERALAKRYRVRGYPTIVFLLADGSEIDRVVGYVDAEQFLAQAEGALANKKSIARTPETLAKMKDSPSLRMENGDALAARNQFKEALAEYLWCFDQGLEKDAAFAAVRATLLLNSIRALADLYPPAHSALLERRDRAERALGSGSATRQQLLDLASLNRVLDENPRTLAAFDKLAGEAGEKLKRDSIDIVIEQLIAARRYQDIINNSEDLSGLVARVLGSYDALLKYADNGSADAEPMLGEMKGYTVKKASGFYEALLATGKGEEAGRVAEQLLNFDSSAETYVLLIKRANVAGRDEMARALAERALKALPEEEHGRIRNLVKN